ncbi:MAG: hypothetical protein PUC05_04620, partial [Firmicutes bacterium]|nr:hypothetical protein [Bacillota bacterium]
MKRMTAFLTAAILLLSLLPIAAFAAGPFEQWDTTGWTKVSDEVLASAEENSLNVLYSKGAAGGNCLEFDFLIKNVTGGLDGNVGAAYKTGGDIQYFFEYNTVSKLARIRRLGTGIDEQMGDEKSLELPKDE